MIYLFHRSRSIQVIVHKSHQLLISLGIVVRFDWNKGGSVFVFDSAGKQYCYERAAHFIVMFPQYYLFNLISKIDIFDITLPLIYQMSKINFNNFSFSSPEKSFEEVR